MCQEKNGGAGKLDVMFDGASLIVCGDERQLQPINGIPTWCNEQVFRGYLKTIDESGGHQKRSPLFGNDSIVSVTEMVWKSLNSYQDGADGAAVGSKHP
jgi:hypothetical protein